MTARLPRGLPKFAITGRARKGWVLVDLEGVANDNQLGGWIQQAVQFVGKLPAREPSQKDRVTRMRPICFSCTETLGLLPGDIAGRILDLGNWTSFKGYAVLPGIQAAEYEVRTLGVVGSRIRVTNTDGSSHVEEIMEWQPEHRLRLLLKEFSFPLSRLTTGFEESWVFKRIDHATRVTRSFELHPHSGFTWPFLWLLAFLLKRAIARHLRQMRDLGQPQGRKHSS